MATIFDLETISTSINDALRANREGNTARRQEALKTAFSLLQGAQTAAQTRETIGRESRTRELFPSVKTTAEEGAKQATQKRKLGDIEVSGAERSEAADIALNKAFAEALLERGFTPATFGAQGKVVTGEEAIQKAKTGKAVSVSAEREVVAGQELGVPELAAAGQAAVEKVRPAVAELQPQLVQVTIDELIASAKRQEAQGKAALLKKKTDTDKVFDDLVLGRVPPEIARQIIAHGVKIKAGTAESLESLDTEIRILDSAKQLIRTSATVQELVAAAGGSAARKKFMSDAMGGAQRPLRSAADKQAAIDEIQVLIDAFLQIRNSVPGAQPLLLKKSGLDAAEKQDALKDLR